MVAAERVHLVDGAGVELHQAELLRLVELMPLLHLVGGAALDRGRRRPGGGRAAAAAVAGLVVVIEQQAVPASSCCCWRYTMLTVPAWPSCRAWPARAAGGGALDRGRAAARAAAGAGLVVVELLSVGRSGRCRRLHAVDTAGVEPNQVELLHACRAASAGAAPGRRWRRRAAGHSHQVDELQAVELPPLVLHQVDGAGLAELPGLASAGRRLAAPGRAAAGRAGVELHQAGLLPLVLRLAELRGDRCRAVAAAGAGLVVVELSGLASPGRRRAAPGRATAAAAAPGRRCRPG
ncbi:MAG: hypothetical protein V4795_00490 [Pseudomonadota bacterium]